jgi:predicted nucleotidyltransferase
LTESRRGNNRSGRTERDNAGVATADAVVELDGNPVDKQRLAELCERYGVAELSVFGSVARGEASKTSDLDLLYVLRPDRSLGFAINRLEDELADLFGRPVDLVSKKALHRMIRDDALAEARLLYAA